jgi:hypothetical protein
MKSFKRHNDYGFWNQDIRPGKISRLGGPTEKLNRAVNFEIFRSLPEGRLSMSAKGKGGRPPYDYVLMFKILILNG